MKIFHRHNILNIFFFSSEFWCCPDTVSFYSEIVSVHANPKEAILPLKNCIDKVFMITSKVPSMFPMSCGQSSTPRQ